MAVDNTGLYYDTIDGFIKWVSANLAGILASDTPNDYSVSEDNRKETIKEALLNAEGEVDGYLAKRGYSTPIADIYERSHNVIRIYVRNIATYELFGRRGITKERYYKYTKTMDMLEKFGNGEKSLPESVPFSNRSKMVLGNNGVSVFSESPRSARHSL